MTLPKTKNPCPICMKTYAAMSKHLKTSHGVLNLKEHQLLLNLASNRVNIRRQPCPVMGCKYESTRLDQHIPSCHTELNQAQVQQYLQSARRATTIALLKKLRSTDPAVPLASCLDLGLEEEERCLQVPPLVMMEEEPQCPNPDCVAQRRSLEQSLMEYRRRAEQSEEELRQLRGMYQQLAKTFKRLSKERGTEATVAVRGREEEEEAVRGREEEEDDEQPGTSYVPDPDPVPGPAPLPAPVPEPAPKEAVPYQESGGSCLEEERWEMEEEEAQQKEQGGRGTGGGGRGTEGEGGRGGRHCGASIFKTQREMYHNLMVRLSPLESSFKASRRVLRAARRAALKSPRTAKKKF